MDSQNQWLELTRTNPDHSRWYVERFRTMASDGADLAGEARLIDAMVPRGARILDAGCGSGRVGGFLAAAGHEVVGVDLDPILIEAARRDHPGPRWLVGDLAELDLPAEGVVEGFDAIVCAGNVVAFLAPDTRREVLRRMGAHLRDRGRVVVGFGAGRGYGFDEFLDDARETGLAPDLLLSTWDLRPFTTDADFLVAVLRNVRVEIWNNPSCSKCAGARSTLDAARVPYRLRAYLEQPPTTGELTEVLRRLGMAPWEICRTGEPAAVALGMAHWPREESHAHRWIEAMVSSPELIQRPILLLDDGSAVLGRTPEALDEAVRRAGQ